MMLAKIIKSSSLIPKRITLHHHHIRRWKHASAVTSLLSQSPPSPHHSDFFNSHSGSYIEEMHSAWQKDPKSVHLSWRVYFNNLESGRVPAYEVPPNLSGGSNKFIGEKGNLEKKPVSMRNKDGLLKILVQREVELMSREYFERGHYSSKLDPLKMSEPRPINLKLERLGEYMEEIIELNSDILPGYKKSGVKSMPVSAVIEAYDNIYCSTIGYDFKHVNDVNKLQWLREKIESPQQVTSLTNEERELALKRLIDADSFERMFASKFATVKRYGVEGGDAMLPGLISLIDYSADLGVNDVTIGMPHRGRLNVFTNLMGQPTEAVFREFSGKGNNPHPLSGDSSYHLTVDKNHMTSNGKQVSLSLTANPSHLEAVNPVTLGITYAKQKTSKDSKSTMAILLHGDAAMAGQGIVYETTGFHNLPHYSTKGNIHMVVNNQIGFTTNPKFSRSSQYCCDVAKIVEAPVFHVNGDDIDAVLRVCKLASEYRNEFKTDVFIDLVCYRRNGHNEVDQPSYTQPKMYSTIKDHPSVVQVYINKILKDGIVKNEDIKAYQQESWQRMEDAYTASKNLELTSEKWSSIQQKDEGLVSLEELFTKIIPTASTSTQREHLESVAKVISDIPSGFKVHDNLIKVLQARKEMATELESIDWATAEQLAFGSLLLEGKGIRLSGQDVERGTFSQRHAVITDQVNESRHIPLHQLSSNLEVCNSHLSEFAVLGFEYGYSLENPQSLVMWEAQFGDFSNVAQCMIDQFIASGEQKWLQPSGLTLLLPHGFDGNGPEHSSGRLERYLQLVDESPIECSEPERQHALVNWSIVNPTTPANYFHMLRRQVHRQFRKPLISFNGKTLLRHPLARSNHNDLTDSSEFQRGYPEQFPDEIKSPSEIKTHIICSGQIYYRLLKARQLNQLDHIAISRIEELSPFPFDLVSQYVSQYPNAELVWCQEEPINMGAYHYVSPRIQTALQHYNPELISKPMRYAGRSASAAVATGHKQRHLTEEHHLISSALYGQPRDVESISNGTPIFTSS